jgi:hypothetical protein
VVGDGCFAAGETLVTARAVHAPPLVAVWILLALRAVSVLLVSVCLCIPLLSVCFTVSL